MASGLGVSVDDAALLAALSHLADVVIEKHARPVARATADAIAREAQQRVRRSSPPAPLRDRSAHLNELIRVEEDARGFVVTAHDTKTRLVVDVYNEFGTQFMSAQPYLRPAAELQKGSYERDLRDAIQAAIDEVGLG